ncbi:hypothetical protein KP509_28G036400 [Ceratopteris richardii]|uniref:GTD-binding domain-containing protein n=1 Tax=Ceratopteris richardii TaxID=49495 RepID=A0A8T2RB61_CERRI|nr:hypothetical protein KP509_28G036400 [Ceratopteris richardii]
MDGRNPWRISALLYLCYEFVFPLFLLFQMFLTVLVAQVTKFLPMRRPNSSDNHEHHNSFCCGHFPPFSPCRQRDDGSSPSTSGGERISTRFSKGRVLNEEQLASGSRCEIASDRKADRNGDVRRSFSMPLAYKRKGRHNGTTSVEQGASVRKRSVDGDTYQSIAEGLELYDGLIEMSAEHLKQRDRGHEEVILSLLSALQVQRKNLRTLYEELDEERVAAETAAIEAMAMIHRLQEEKSALQMEAEHFQRMAEEKARHDERAIQLLEEDLCRKENERVHLEEELSDLRSKCFGSGTGNGNGFDEAREVTPQYYTNAGTPILLLTRGLEAPGQKEHKDGSLVTCQECTDLTLAISSGDISLDGSCEWLQSDDAPIKKFRSLALHELGHSNEFPNSDEISQSAVGAPHEESEKSLLDGANDAKAILLQLSAVEKQLLALEESEKMDLWNQVQASQDSLIHEILKSNEHSLAKYDSNNRNNVNLQSCDDNMWASEIEASTVLAEEKVVNVDVANISCSTSQVPTHEVMIEIHEGKRRRSRFMQWECSEDEKHLSIPNFAKNRSDLSSTSVLEGPMKPVSRALQITADEDEWESKRVISLDGIALGDNDESTLMHDQPVSSNGEHVNLVMLKEVVQGLQELLKGNKNVSATNETLSSLSVYLKGT